MNGKVAFQNNESDGSILPLNNLFTVYIDNQQYQSYLARTKNFYLIFELSKKNRQHLLSIVNDCTQHPHFKGLIFVIDKMKFCLRDYFFTELDSKIG